MTFDVLFDFWLAKKVDSLFKDGYNEDQVKILMNMVYSDFCDIIDDNETLKEIRKRIVRTVEIFMMGEKNDTTN